MEKSKLTDKAGYVMLGVCLDYFLMKPVRVLKPMATFWVGVACGFLYAIGMENLFTFFGRFAN